jgi:hypothetical protein
VRKAFSAMCVLAGTASLIMLPQAAYAAGPRIDLTVLVVSDGNSPVDAIEGQLKTEGVPYKKVDLNDPGRPVIDTAFLQDTVGGAPRAKYQAVVLPNADPFANAAEMTALVNFEKQFGIRQFDGYVYPTAGVGLSAPTYTGSLDGTTATVSPTGLSGALRYLKGPVTFEDNAPDVPESYGYLANPAPAAGTTFDTYLTGTAPGGGGSGTLAGVYTHDGRSEMVMTYAYNVNQWQFRTIGHGLISWLTKGVHLGYDRNYFSVHVDDIFLPDARWSISGNCTPGEGCADPNITTPDIRMTPADVTAAVSWQTQKDFTLDLFYNGGGSDEVVAANGSDPLLTSFQSNRAKFRWANHTFQHPYLGCVQDLTVIPWRCQTDANGNVQYVSKADIKDQITLNRTWGQQKGFSIQSNELVTGEHSGLKILPQQPNDNPNLAAALTETGIRWTGSDASREKNQRTIGAAQTVPRYPMSVFFNAAKVSEEVDEYNWIYGSRANGGSGLCEDNPGAVTCIAPLDPATGFTSYIIPIDARIDLSHIVANDPRPHYVHQSNLTEDRILYPLMDKVLGDYRAAFAANAPIVNLRTSAIGSELDRQDAWRAKVGTFPAYVQDGKVTIQPPSGLAVPITMPEGTKDTSGLLGGLLGGSTFGTAYAGDRSDYKTGTTQLTLPAGALS